MVSCTYVCSLLAFNLGYLNRPSANISVGLLSVTCGAWQGLICLLHPRPTWWQSAYVLSLPCSPLVFPDLFLVSHWRCVCSAHSWTALVTQSRDVNSRNPRPIIGFKWHFGSPPGIPLYLMLVYWTASGVLLSKWRPGWALESVAQITGIGRLECHILTSEPLNYLHVTDLSHLSAVTEKSPCTICTLSCHIGVTRHLALAITFPGHPAVLGPLFL